VARSSQTPKLAVPFVLEASWMNVAHGGIDKASSLGVRIEQIARGE